jgi:hypothetical protein
LKQAHSAGLKYFNAYETLVRDSGLLGAHEHGHWVVGLADDCHAVLETVANHYQMMEEACPKVGLNFADYTPSTTAYASMQRMVVQHLDKGVADALHQRFQARNLPVYGFTHPAPDPTGPLHNPRNYFGVGCACLLVAVVLGLWAFAIGSPTSQQMLIFRSFFALASGFAAGAFVGSLTVKARGLWPGIVATATGGFGVWLLTPFLFPDDTRTRSVTLFLSLENQQLLTEDLTIVVRFGDEDQEVRTTNRGRATLAVRADVNQIDAVLLNNPNYELVTPGPYPIQPNQPINLVLKRKGQDQPPPSP